MTVSQGKEEVKKVMVSFDMTSRESMRIGLDMGKWSNLPGKFKCVNDPCNTVYKNSDEIFLGGLWMYKENISGSCMRGAVQTLFFKKIDEIKN